MIVTAVFSVPIFVIPASMLTWGFEVSALRNQTQEASVSVWSAPPEQFRILDFATSGTDTGWVTPGGGGAAYAEKA